MIWVEQPIGTGFTSGTPTARNEEDVAAQFMGFWKNFVDTFSIQGYKVYIAGESYAGAYCPYIASAFLDSEDKTYFNMKGMVIYDPVIAVGEIQEPIPTLAFTEYWAGLFPFNDTFRAELKAADKKCGYSDYMNEYLVYPPRGQQPSKLPGTSENGITLDACWNIFNDAISAASDLNPCFDIYHVATTCPLQWDVLGFPGSIPYLPDGASVYFNRDDVKKAINAPTGVTWQECTDVNVFPNGDSSPPSGLTVLPGVIERTGNVIIGHGALDMILLANGTLLAIQNMTWGGKLGFQRKPDEPFYVPYHDSPFLSTIAASGVFGSTHTERGLTYVGINLSGHMVPQYAPSAAYRHVEFLLGRVKSLSSTDPFTTDPNFPQSAGPLGDGTAPQGWSNEPGYGKTRRSAKMLRDGKMTDKLF
jgi:carboxypeptidase D